MVNTRRNPKKKGRIWVERTLRGGAGVETLPSPKYWRVSARRMRAAGGPPETQRSCISGQSASIGCPPWGSYLEGLDQKRPFQTSTSSESVITTTSMHQRKCYFTLQGPLAKNILFHMLRKKFNPLGSEVYCPTNTATPIP